MGGIALLILVAMAFGVMFRIIRPNKILWFIVLLLILPIAMGTGKQAFGAVFSSQSSWTTWVIGSLVILIGIRLFFDRFRRRH